MKKKTIVSYRVVFKNRLDDPIVISVEGGKELIECLASDDCPRFVTIRGRAISTYLIDQVFPIEK